MGSLDGDSTCRDEEEVMKELIEKKIKKKDEMAPIRQRVKDASLAIGQAVLDLQNAEDVANQAMSDKAIKELKKVQKVVDKALGVVVKVW